MSRAFSINKCGEMRDLAEHLEGHRLSDPHIGPEDCDLIVAALLHAAEQNHIPTPAQAAGLTDQQIEAGAAALYGDGWEKSATSANRKYCRDKVKAIYAALAAQPPAAPVETASPVGDDAGDIVSEMASIIRIAVYRANGSTLNDGQAVHDSIVNCLRSFLRDGPLSRSSADTADDLRAAGWTVAVHNDYRLNGQSHTFWLLTKDGRAIKGEGLTDREALDQCRAIISAEPQTASSQITAEDTFRATLRVIAHWAEVDLSGEWETGLRGVIRSITDAAREALSAYPSSPLSRPQSETGK